MTSSWMRGLMARRRAARTLAFASPMVSVVDDSHTTDTCAGDELGCEATDTAETDDEDVTLGELAHALVTEEEAGTLGPRLGRNLLLGLVHWMPRSLRACW